MLTDQDYELLSNYLDDALDSAERADLETRLNGETELRRELEALRGTVALIQTLPPRKAPRNFTLDAAMARRPAPPRRVFFSPVLVSALSAVAAVLLIGFGLLSLLTNQSAAPTTASFAAQEEVGVAQLPTETPLLKASDGNSMGDTASELPPSPPQEIDLAVRQTETNDLLNQASGAGGQVSVTFIPQDGQLQQTAPIAPGAEVNSVALPQSTSVVSQFAAPSTSSGTIEGFSMSAAAAQDSAQTGAASLSTESDQAIIEMTSTAPLLRTVDTETPSPSETLTMTPTPSDTPTETPMPPSATPQPTVPAVSAPVSAYDTLPLASLVAGIILLVGALVFYLRSRRRQ